MTPEEEFLIVALLILALVTATVVGLYLRAKRRRKLKERALSDTARLLEWFDRFVHRSKGEYISASEMELWTVEAPDPADFLPSKSVTPHVSPDQTTRYTDALKLLDDPNGWREVHNRTFVNRRMSEVRAEGLRGPAPKLTDAQLQAVVTNEDNNLVLAGAGSGKTTTIAARVAYLLRWGLARPQEILILAFNRSVAEEIKERLDSLGLHGVEVRNFHSKGYEELGRVMGYKPAVSRFSEDELERRRLFQRKFDELKADPNYRETLYGWLVDLMVPQEELDACDTPDELIRKENSYDLRAMNGVRLKSQAELRVANWLTLHGIPWEYEAVYPDAPKAPNRREYTPDFYLPRDEVWLEVWACNREGELPTHFDGPRYLESMEWKRALHAQKQTRLLEVYQDDFTGEGISWVMHRLMEEGGVDARPISEEELNTILEETHITVKQFVGLIDTFLNLMRGGGWSWEAVQASVKSPRDRVFLELFHPFLEHYEAILDEEGKIDFHEMLARFARDPEDALPTSGYPHVIVDEAQDLSRAQVAFLTVLRPPDSPGRVFSVGDDWQSIYHFAGADPSILKGLPDHLGVTATTALDRTFRLYSDVLHVSSEFIGKNPNQFEKRMTPRGKSVRDPGVCVCLYQQDREFEALSWCLQRIVKSSTGDVDVLILARYNHLLDDEVIQKVQSAVPERVAIRTSTIHRAKGLEADFTVVLGLVSGTYGFPSELSDDPVLRMVTGEMDHFPNAEERRVFYVALTRTRNRVFLLAPEQGRSTFVQELRGEEYARAIEWVGKTSEVYRCPRCEGKTIRRTVASEGSFWGCLNYPQCHGKLPACDSCDEGGLEAQVVGRAVQGFKCVRCGIARDLCPRCRQGAVLEKEGRYGRFLGCSEWRRDESGCPFTRNLP